jgi:uncharacterized membrane protein (UPF0127 family)
MRLLVLPLILLAFLAPRPVFAGSGPAAALPDGSRLVASIALAGNAHAVIYDTGAAYVGVVTSAHGRPVLTWHESLPFPADTLFAPEGTTAFAGIGTRRNSTEGEFFAFRLGGGKVHPALAARSHGILTAEEGVHLSQGIVTTREHDAAHVGSVAYAVLTRYEWQVNRYAATLTTRRPDYVHADLPHPRGTVKTRHGDTILLRLEVANTEQEREVGLMNRSRLDLDSGMIFVWTSPILESFWMENTYIPLTVAFLAPDGTIQEMQDMQPLTTDLHTPAKAYQYAIEVNKGFFARNGIQVGDTVELLLN